MNPCIIIPSRYASSRYPAKPLALLNGQDGAKTLIQRVWERGCEVLDPKHVFVATDHDEIADHVRAFGGQVLMTSSSCKNGTERCAEAAKALTNYDIIVNLQGDAPLTPPDFLQALIAEMKHAEVATPVLRMDAESYEMFTQDRRNGQVGGTTVVMNQNKQALYFSKEVIPFLPAPSALADTPVFHHVGAYAYTHKALATYMSLPETPYEKCEGLEQLRFLENSIPVSCVEVEGRGRVFWELNNPIDVERIEKVLK